MDHLYLHHDMSLAWQYDPLCMNGMFWLLSMSRLDAQVDMEERFCQRVKQLGCTCVTISHRPALMAFHDVVLALDGEGAWSLHRGARAAAHAPSAPPLPGAPLCTCFVHWQSNPIITMLTIALRCLLQITSSRSPWTASHRDFLNG